VESLEPEFTITRTTVVRVNGPLDDTATERLMRILNDLIEDQGITDLVLDLSGAHHLGPEVVSVLEAARTRMAELGGLLELRAPRLLSAEVVELAEGIPTFTPLELGLEDYS
jgi:anti-anti-sigma regulatory factor